MPFSLPTNVSRCYLNCSSVVVDVSSVCLFFSVLQDKKKDFLGIERECVEGRALRTVKPDNSDILIVAFMSCGYKQRLSNLLVDGNAACFLMCLHNYDPGFCCVAR